MPDICTCGTTLVEGAWFCHRCGKPQREILAPEPLDAQPVVHAPVVVASPQPVSFRNSIALRIGFLTASVAAMLDAVSGSAPFFVVWSALAGFFAVMLYQRRTGQALTTASGAKMGCITSVLNAVILLVLWFLKFISNTAELSANFHQQLSTMKTNDPTGYASVAPLLENPYGLGLILLVFLMMLIGIFTVAGTAGGALGAKVGKKG